MSAPGDAKNTPAATHGVSIGEDLGVVSHGDLAIERVLRLRVNMARSQVFEKYINLTTVCRDRENLARRVDEACSSSKEYMAAVADYNNFVANSSNVTNSLHTDGPLEDALIELAKAKRSLEQSEAATPQQPALIKAADEKVQLQLLSVVNRHNGVTAADEIIASALARAEKGKKRRRREMAAVKSFLARLAMAMFGSLSLLVPMLIMYLVPQPLAVLLVTSISVLLVALALTYFLKDATGNDLFGAAAAYAAVLVVFVGTGDSNGEARAVLAGTIDGSGILNGTIQTVVPDPAFSDGAIGGIVAGVIVGMLLLETVNVIVWGSIWGRWHERKDAEACSGAPETQT